MKFRSLFFVLPLLVIVIVVTGIAIGQEGSGPELAENEVVTVSTAFTYQGQLKSDGSPVRGNCDFRFQVFNAITGGSQVGSTISKSNVEVVDGRFTVDLNPGDIFNGNERWLNIEVRCPAGLGDYTALSPRQHLTGAPYALYANNAGALDGLDSSAYAPANLVVQDSIDVVADITAIVVANTASLNLPDKCTGSMPVDQWTVLAQAYGSIYSPTSSDAFAFLGFSLNSTTGWVDLSHIEITLGAGADWIQSYSSAYLFTNVSSGTQIFRLMANELGSDSPFNLWRPRLIVQALGYTCGASVTETSSEEGLSVSDGEIVNAADFILAPSDR